MRTKHVLMTTALMAVFAACTNDEFISNEQGVQSVDELLRPQVDVTLNVQGDGGANTRMAYEGGEYVFEDGNVIGALLMDKLVGSDRPNDDLEAWEEKPWLTRYELVDYINTDYPFTRTNGQWKTDAKMLEGNYFFTFPFASYEGYREAVHSIGEQVQEGQDIAKAYADNQFFIGYNRIHAGTDGGDVMNASLELVPTLGAVGIQVKNVGTEPFTVKKIVLATEAKDRAKGLSTLIKIDPTDAMYEGEIDGASAEYVLNNNELSWVDKISQKYFNYANYEEMYTDGTLDEKGNAVWKYNEKFLERYTEDGELVNNTEKSANYNRREALRKVVKGIEDSDQRAELTVENGPEIKTGEHANFIIMTNEYEYSENGDNAISAYVYTDRGMVGPVALAGVNFEVNEGTGNNGKPVTVISNNPLLEINPNTNNTIALAVDNNSVQGPIKMNIYNEEDLVQFIEWNKGLARSYTAELMNDITLTKEMSDMLTDGKWKETVLVINSDAEKKVEIAADAAANIMDYVVMNTEVEVLGNIELGTNSYVKGEYNLNRTSGTTTVDKQKLDIAEGANVTVVSAIEYKQTGDMKNQALVVAENEGTLTINGNVARLTVEENKGVMNVNATVSLNGKSENKPEATINVSASGIMNCGEAGNLTNKGRKLGSGEIEYAVINNDGRIMNLVNAMYGKVIVGEGDNVLTNVNSNYGIIDITANIETNLNTKEGTISYTVGAGKSVTMAKVVKYNITELVVDGGSVTSADATEAGTASAVKKVVVTKNGGVIGGDAASTLGTTDTEIEINGNVTLENLTIPATENIEVKNGVTTINGNVDAKSATFVLGSYEDYTVQTGELFIPSADDKLVANTITKDVDPNVKEGNAKVSNNGTVVLTTKESNVAWEGTTSVRPEGAKTEAPETMLVDGSNFSTLKDLQEALSKYDVTTTLETITISTALDMSLEDNKNYVSVLANKNLRVSANMTAWSADNKVTVKTLTLTADAQIGTGGETITPNQTIITVTDKLDFADHILTLNYGYIQIDGKYQIGDGCSKIVKGGMNAKLAGSKGKIVTKNMASSFNELIQWNFTDSKWEALQ